MNKKKKLVKEDENKISVLKNKKKLHFRSFKCREMYFPKIQAIEMNKINVLRQ